jgi:hypothetical protein
VSPEGAGTLVSYVLALSQRKKSINDNEPGSWSMPKDGSRTTPLAAVL